MKTATIIEEDVLSVAESIGKTLTTEEVDEILENYPAAQEDDPIGTWNLVIENLIHHSILLREKGR